MKTSNSCSRILRWALILVTLGAGQALAAPTANGRVVYGVNSLTPQQRAYAVSTNTFGAAAATPSGANPAFVVDRASSTRNEHIAGYVSTGGVLYVLRWNGTAWTNEWNVSVGGTGVNGRRFDIAYERTTGNAVVVYSNNANAQLRYNSWNGTAWAYTTATAPTITSARLTAIPNAIKLSSRRTAGSNEIAAAVADTAGDLTALVWSGSAWGNEPTAALSTTLQQAAAAGDKEVFDLAHESQSGELFVVYSDATPNNYYRTYVGGTWSAATALSATGRTIQSMFAVADPDPASNRILTGWDRTASANRYGRVWDGGALLTAGTVGANAIATAPPATSHQMTGGWVTSGGSKRAVIVYQSTTATNVDYAWWDVTSAAWTVQQASTGYTSGDKRWADMDADPQSADALMLTYSDLNGDLWAKRLQYDGTNFTWTNADGGAALTTTLTNVTTQNFAFAYDRYVPPAGTLALGAGTEATGGTLCATGSATYVDHFTLLASSATNVNAIATTLSASVPAGLLSLLEVTDDAGAAQGSLPNPSGASPAVSGMTFAAPTGTAAQYRLRVTPNAAATSSATFTATVSGVTTSGGFTVNGSDTSAATIVVDGAASPDVTGASAAPSAGTVTASWTNPGAGTLPGTDFASYVVVLGNTVPITGAPTKGVTTYFAGNTVGADSVVCAGNVATCPKTGLGSSQIYYLKIFTRDGCGNWSAGVQVSATTPNLNTTIADGTNPGAASRAPGGLEAPLDAFTLQASTGATDTVTAVTVTLANGTFAGIGSARIMSGSTCTGTQYGPTVAPTGNAIAFTGTNLPVTSAVTPFYVCVTPKSHGAMPAPPGAVYAVTGTVTSWSSTNPQLGTDGSSGTVTIDNASSPDVTGASATGAATTVTASWTNPGAGVAPATDFGSYVVVLGNTVPVTNAPSEGTATYTANGTNTIGGDLIVCAGNVATCQKTALGAGQTYHLEIFTRDTVNNWSAGVAVSAATTDARTTPLSLAGTAVGCGLVNLSAAYTGDSPTSNNTVTFARGTAASGPFTNLAACTNVGGGTNPRTCADGTVAANTGYYYRATFTDTNGIVGSASVDSGLVSVGACPSTLAATAGTMPAAANVTAGSSGTIVGRLVFTAANGTATVSSLSVSNTGTALAASDVSTLTLHDDASGAFLGAGAWNAATSRWDFSGLALDVAVGTPATVRLVLGVNIGATVGRTFALRVNVPADVTVPAPMSVSNTATISGNAFTVVAGAQAGSTNTNAPMVSILNPATGAVVSPNNQYRVQIRVFNPAGQSGIAGITANSVQLSTDNGTTWPLTATRVARYDSGTPTITGTVYEALVTAPAAGSYTLRARASNGVPLTVVSEPVQIAVASANRGDGNLLVRDNSAQLCTDCHALQTHSSEAVGTKYGSWAMTCRDCHAPHGTRNVMLVNETITPPSVNGVQTAKNVGFVTMTGDSNAAGWDGTNRKPTGTGSFVNSDNSGPCQVCHTRTQSGGGVARWRNTGNADSHYTAGAGTQACTNCHGHGSGFGGGESTGGAACAGCHSTIKTLMAGTDAAGTGAAASKHSLVNFTDSANDVVPAAGDWGSAGITTLSQVPAAQRSCVNMCHSDHPHDLTSPALATHDNNLYLDPSTQATRGNGSANRTSGFRTKADFDPVANTGMCTRCHSKPIAAGRPTITAADYGASAHDFTSTATPALTWQYVLHDGGTTQRNCTKCHTSRTEGTTPSVSGSGVSAVHGTSDPSLLAGDLTPGAANNATRPASFVCYNCHMDTAPVDGAMGNRSNRNVWSATQTTYYHPVNTDTVHDGAAEAAAGYNSGRFSGANRHANCGDCHDPHAAGGTRIDRSTAVTRNATRNAIPANTALYGAYGVAVTYPGTAIAMPANCAANVSIPNTCWPAATSTWYGATLTRATYEYEVCFKCHSSFAFGATTPFPTYNPGGSSNTQATDLAQEFNPALVRSGHPVVTGLNNYLNSTAPKALNATQVLAPWNVNVGTQTMLCTDCHNTEAASPTVQGPHGSAVTFFLTGVNKAWPYTIAGATSGTLWAVDASETNLGNANGNGLFCRNCHPNTNTTSSNTIHSGYISGRTSGDHPRACVGCHVRVPHGSKVSRLIVTTNAPARYKVSGTNPFFDFYRKSANYRSYNNTYWNDNAGCSQHTSTTPTEAW